jgi:dienelactone hydrolase
MPTRREVLELLAVAPVAGLAGSALTAAPAAAAPAAAPATAPGAAPAAPAGARPATDVLVRDVSVPVPGADAVPAYLVLPGGRRAAHTAPAVLFLHWFDPLSVNSDRTEFLAEAVRLAARGVVSLLPQQAFPWSGDPVGDARDVATVRREVARMRRALDALLRRPEVDRHRVAVVGHDYGAMYGALLAAADSRVSALAALTADATWAHWFLAYWLRRDDPAYAALFAGLEPVDAVARVAANRPVLLQFADDDPYVDAATRDRFRAAAPEATQTVFPDAGHRLDLAALQERTAWLARVLGLPS